MASLHSSVLTRILGQKLQVPRILRAAQYSAQQCSEVPGQLGKSVLIVMLGLQKKKRSSQFDELNTQLYVL